MDGTNADDARDGLTPATSVRTIQQGFSLKGATGTLSIAEGLDTESTGQSRPASGSGDLIGLGAGSDLSILDGEFSSRVMSLS